MGTGKQGTHTIRAHKDTVTQQHINKNTNLCVCLPYCVHLFCVKGLNTQQVNTMGQQTNDRTGAETRTKQNSLFQTLSSSQFLFSK